MIIEDEPLGIIQINNEIDDDFDSFIILGVKVLVVEGIITLSFQIDVIMKLINHMNMWQHNLSLH